MWVCELTPHDQCVEGALVSLGMVSCETERNPTSQAEDPMWLHCQTDRNTRTKTHNTEYINQKISHSAV